LTDKAATDDLLHIPLADRIFKVFLIGTFLIGGLVLAQLLNLGVLKHRFYAVRAASNASNIKIEPAPRGIIYDRFGKPLVKNEPAFNAFLAPSDLPKDPSERLAAFGKISDVLGIDQSAFDRKISEKDWNLNDELLLSDNLTHDELVTLSSENIPGVRLEPTFKRAGDPPFALAHLIGYAGLAAEDDLKNDPNLTADDLIGRDGLEAYYDDYLRGQNGREVFLKDSRGEIKGSESRSLPAPGDAIQTFIDKDFQIYFYNQLQAALSGLGRQIGLGLAINPQNGEVLALFNIPSFDPAQLSRYLTAPNNPLFNRAIAGLYNPGSTIKPLVATAALAEGTVTVSKMIYSPGYLDVPNPYDPANPSRFLDWRPQGWVDLHSALARSSNVYFYEVGGGLPAQAGLEGQVGLGVSRLRKWWHKFGLDQKTNIDLVGEESGFLPSPDWKEEKTGKPWLIGDTYNVSIGQGDLLITPLELLNYIAAIANGGRFFEPRIMKDVKDSKGNILLESRPTVFLDLSVEIGGVLPDVRQGMRDAVQKSYGTSYLLSDLPVRVAAKTGSAQTNNNAKVNALFVGYEPYDNPQIAILIMVENAVEGSLNVVPVAKKVMLWYYENRIKNQR